MTKPKRRIRLEGYPEIPIVKPFIKKKGFSIGRPYVRFGINLDRKVAEVEHVYIEVDGRIIGYFHFHRGVKVNGNGEIGEIFKDGEIGEISFMAIKRYKNLDNVVGEKMWLAPHKDGDVMLMLRQLKVDKVSTW